jgi:hypothetical protein
MRPFVIRAEGQELVDVVACDGVLRELASASGGDFRLGSLGNVRIKLPRKVRVGSLRTTVELPCGGRWASPPQFCSRLEATHKSDAVPGGTKAHGGERDIGAGRNSRRVLKTHQWCQVSRPRRTAEQAIRRGQRHLVASATTP